MLKVGVQLLNNLINSKLTRKCEQIKQTMSTLFYVLTGFHILLWNRKQEIARKQAILKDGMISSMVTSGSRNLVSGSGISDHRSRPRPRQQKKKKTEDDDDDDLKKKTKTKSKGKTESVRMKNPSKKEK